MSVTVRTYRRGGWEVDVRVQLADGTRRREKKRVSITSRTAAQRWGEARERELLLHGVAKPPKEVPTLQEFVPRFLDGHAGANRQKPSGIAGKECILRVHLVPRLGTKRLNGITSEDVQRLKSHLHAKAPKTVNNVLTVLGVMLKKAVEWDVIERVPCAIRLLPIAKPSASFHDFDVYERLVEAAGATDSQAQLIVLLGGEAGLRCGEMLGLEWTDVDLAKRQLCIQRSVWKGHVTSPKGGRLRYVPLTLRLAAALRSACDSRDNSATRFRICAVVANPLRSLLLARCSRSRIIAPLHFAGATHDGFDLSEQVQQPDVEQIKPALSESIRCNGRCFSLRVVPYDHLPVAFIHARARVRCQY